MTRIRPLRPRIKRLSEVLGIAAVGGVMLGASVVFGSGEESSQSVAGPSSDGEAQPRIAATQASRPDHVAGSVTRRDVQSVTIQDLTRGLIQLRPGPELRLPPGVTWGGISPGDMIQASGMLDPRTRVLIASIVEVNVVQVWGRVVGSSENGVWQIAPEAVHTSTSIPRDGSGNIKVGVDASVPPIGIDNRPFSAGFELQAGEFVSLTGVLRPNNGGVVTVTKLVGRSTRQ